SFPACSTDSAALRGAGGPDTFRTPSPGLAAFVSRRRGAGTSPRAPTADPRVAALFPLRRHRAHGNDYPFRARGTHRLTLDARPRERAAAVPMGMAGPRCRASRDGSSVVDVLRYPGR